MKEHIKGLETNKEVNGKYGKREYRRSKKWEEERKGNLNRIAKDKEKDKTAKKGKKKIYIYIKAGKEG